MILCGVVFTAAAALIVGASHADVARTGIVHMFEWRFDDIAKECEQFLGPYGYAGIQVSPVNEYAIIEGRPWWERYQPFSYRIISRSGDENGFKDMCTRCNNVGIKVYVDVTLNDMSGTQAAGTKGTGGSVPDSGAKNYPDVPYTESNFHSTCTVNNYNDANNVRNCELVGLHDLDQSQEYVRGKMADFLNKLVELGASGFRVDAAKHMWPADLKVIFDRVNNLPSGERPLVYQEVADGGVVEPSEYFDIGMVTEFKFGKELSNCFKGNNALKWLTNFGEPWNLMKSDKALVFIDNHDTQRSNDVLNYKSDKAYKMAVGFMLSWTYGMPRVMSSFDFSSSDQGPPANSDGSIKNVTFNSDMSCSNGWVCEHRWRQIYSMVKFANVVKGTSVTNFTDNGSKQISYCRGNKGFVAFNGDSYDMTSKAQTCLPAGSYCDVISGLLQDGKCTGKTVQVGSDGTAEITIKSDETDGFLAIHLESKIGSTPTPNPTTAPTTSSSDDQTIEPSRVKAIIDKYDQNYKEYRAFLCARLMANC